jgi:hypothetical protein
MNNGSLTPVFNIRGMDFTESSTYTKFEIEDTANNRIKIAFNEETGIIYKDSSPELSTESIENAFGVVKIHTDKSEFNTIIGIKINIDENCKYTLLTKLKSLGVKGLFFVR